jgi:hypothetical protein
MAAPIWNILDIPPSTGRSHFTPELHSHKMPKTTQNSHLKVYFLGVRGLTASSYIVYEYTPSGHADLYIICTVCKAYTFFYTVYAHFYTCF